MDDDIDGAVWVVGATETNSRNAFAVIVPNRECPTMVEVFRRFVRPGTIQQSDGHASYPVVAKEVML